MNTGDSRAANFGNSLPPRQVKDTSIDTSDYEVSIGPGSVPDDGLGLGVRPNGNSTQPSFNVSSKQTTATGISLMGVSSMSPGTGKTTAAYSIASGNFGNPQGTGQFAANLKAFHRKRTEELQALVQMETDQFSEQFDPDRLLATPTGEESSPNN